MEKRLLFRWWGPLAASLTVFLASLALARQFFFGATGATTPGLMAMAMNFPIITRFAWVWVLREVLTLYLAMAMAGWALTASLAPWLVGMAWRQAWRGRHAFLATLGGLLLMHAWLWAKVPTALWVIPGLRLLPLGLSLVLVPLAGLGCLRLAFPRGRGGHLAALALSLPWLLLAQLPFLFQGDQAPVPNSHPAELVVLAIDGLRPDVAAAEGLEAFHGQHAENAFTPVPATRLLYGLLLGGDPMRFTTGHLMPDLEEYEGKVPLYILREAKAAGKKVRFCIDDGGTIGLMGRGSEFDQVIMPARGWENFLNSNLSVHLPIYASWLDTLRVFPTTNPWTRPTHGLTEALDAGRGGDWLFFHSCLTHQPIYLTRGELGSVPGWWGIPATKFEPLLSLEALTADQARNWDERCNPFLAYRIRVHTLMTAWAPIWNGLAQDPVYGKATRIFFSDHGERFPHLTEQVQMAGIHGFSLSPWDLKMPMVLDGPGAGSEPFSAPLSLLGFRAALHDLATGQRRPTLARMAEAPVVSLLNPTQSPDLPPDTAFQTATTLATAQAAFIGPDGLWGLSDPLPMEARSAHSSVARLEGGNLVIYIPLRKGGAQRQVWQGYQLLGEQDVDEAAFQKARGEVEATLKTQALTS